MSKYCTICGKEKTVKVDLDSYNENTGKRNYELICPDRYTCTHNYHENVKRRFLGLFGVKCTDCGRTGDYINQYREIWHSW